MLFKKSDATVRKSSEIEIFNFLTKKNSTQFSVAKVYLKGDHSPTINKISDRAYLILSGEATIKINGDSYMVQSEDVVFIPKGSIHSMKGNISYYVINSPSFDPKDEEKPK